MLQLVHFKKGNSAGDAALVLSLLFVRVFVAAEKARPNQ